MGPLKNDRAFFCTKYVVVVVIVVAVIVVVIVLFDKNVKAISFLFLLIEISLFYRNSRV